MRLYALNGLTGVGPNLDLTVLTARIAEAFFIERDTGEESRCISSAHDTWLLQSLGHIRWVPKHYLLWSHCGKPQIVGPLRPGNVEDSVS